MTLEPLLYIGQNVSCDTSSERSYQNSVIGSKRAPTSGTGAITITRPCYATPTEPSHVHATEPRDPTLSVGCDEQLLYINVQRFRGGLVFKAHRLVYDSTLGLRVIKK